MEVGLRLELRLEVGLGLELELELELELGLELELEMEMVENLYVRENNLVVIGVKHLNRKAVRI